MKLIITTIFLLFNLSVFSQINIESLQLKNKPDNKLTIGIRMGLNQSIPSYISKYDIFDVLGYDFKFKYKYSNVILYNIKYHSLNNNISFGLVKYF